MSVNSGGIIYFNREFESVEEEIQFSFLVQKIGNKNKIGINQGGNVKEHTKKGINFAKGEECKEYFFEIADDPLDFNAEYIFGGYDFDLSEINEYDSFEHRMERVKLFLEELLNLPNVAAIEVFINISVGDHYQYIESEVDQFEKFLKESFVIEEGGTPKIYIRISK